MTDDLHTLTMDAIRARDDGALNVLVAKARGWRCIPERAEYENQYRDIEIVTDYVIYRGKQVVSHWSYDMYNYTEERAWANCGLPNVAGDLNAACRMCWEVDSEAIEIVTQTDGFKAILTNCAYILITHQSRPAR